MTMQPTTSKRHTFAIFGATGGTGAALVTQALRAGHAVRALVRSRARLEAGLDEPSRSAVERGQLSILEGDVTDPAAVDATVSGADVVLCSLGAPGRDRSGIRARGTQVIIDAMNRLGVERIIAVSVYGAAETRQQLPWYYRHLFFPLFIGPAVADHEEQERRLAASGLHWTAVRPPNLVSSRGPAGVLHAVGNAEGMAMKISRAELAEFILGEADADAYVRRAPWVAQAA
jgi:uncharacterized protein YbjT (DUF2867 family)